MFFTLGAILTVGSALLCLLTIGMLSIWWLAARVRRLSKLVSAATHSEKAPARWESRLQELEADQVSLSSSYEKVARELKRLNSRAGMREFRAESTQAELPIPPVGTSKADLLRHYGMAGKVGPDFARAQMQREISKEN